MKERLVLSNMIVCLWWQASVRGSTIFTACGMHPLYLNGTQLRAIDEESSGLSRCCNALIHHHVLHQRLPVVSFPKLLPPMHMKRLALTHIQLLTRLEIEREVSEEHAK